MIVRMNHEGNRGYSADQVVDSATTLDDLLAAVQDAIDEWGGDSKVVLHQTNNGHGANYGTMEKWGDLFEAIEDDDE